MVNHLLETSHPLYSSALCLCVSVADPSSILRTHFQVPYPLSPLFATLTKTAGCVPKIPILGSSHFLRRRGDIRLDCKLSTIQEGGEKGPEPGVHRSPW
jgi:hypothetical protein